MTTVYLKRCPHCGGDVEFRPAGGMEPDSSLVCFQCGWSPARKPPGRTPGRPVGPPAPEREQRKAVADASVA